MIGDHEARVNVTWSGCNGDLPDPVQFDAGDADIRSWVTEALQGGSVPGIPASPQVDLTDHIVERFEATDSRPVKMIFIRPKTAFGG